MGPESRNLLYFYPKDEDGVRISSLKHLMLQTKAGFSANANVEVLVECLDQATKKSQRPNGTLQLIFSAGCEDAKI